MLIVLLTFAPLPHITGSTLLFCPGEVQGLLSPVGAVSTLLVSWSQGQFSHSHRWQRAGEGESLPFALHHMVDEGWARSPMRIRGAGSSLLLPLGSILLCRAMTLSVTLIQLWGSMLISMVQPARGRISSPTLVTLDSLFPPVVGSKGQSGGQGSLPAPTTT